MSAHEKKRAGSELVNAQWIASVAQVGPSAVSNWKRRRPGFPAEVQDGLFSRDEVVSWLEREGKTVVLPEVSIGELARKLVATVRRALSHEEPGSDGGLELLLQFMVLLAGWQGALPRLQPLQEIWTFFNKADFDWDGVDEGDDPNEEVDIAAWIRRLVAGTDPSLASALRFPWWLEGAVASWWVNLWDDLRLDMESFSQERVDWGHLSAAVLEANLDNSASGGQASSGGGLVAIMSALLEPIGGSVYDPACGAASFLASSWRSNSDRISRLYGQEISEGALRIGALNLLLHNADFDLEHGDTIVDDRFRKLRADRIAAQPPISARLRSIVGMEGDPRWFAGLPPKTSADLAWVQHVVFHLAEEGVGVVAVAAGALFRQGRAESEIRRRLLSEGVVDAIFQLPPGMVSGASASMALVVLQKDCSARQGEVLFVDARQIGTPERGGLRSFSLEDIEIFRSVIREWRAGEFLPKPGFSGVASVEEIVQRGANLIPNRYISYTQEVAEIGGEPIGERYDRLLSGFGRPEELLWSLAGQVRGGGMETFRLGELLSTKPQAGSRQKSDGPGETYPFIETRSVSAGAPSLLEPPIEATTTKRGISITQFGDLLILSRGVERNESVPCATVRFDGPAAFAESLILLRPNTDLVDPDFLRLYLQSRRGSSALAAAATGSVISNLTRDAMMDVEIVLPDLAAQRGISHTLVAMEVEREEMKARLDLFGSLLDTAREGLTGGILGHEADSIGANGK